MLLCEVSSCWMSLCWVSWYWMSYRRTYDPKYKWPGALSVKRSIEMLWRDSIQGPPPLTHGMLVGSFMNNPDHFKMNQLDTDYFNQQGSPYSTGRISTVDLLVLTSSFELLSTLKLYFSLLRNNLSYWGGQPYRAFPFSKHFLQGSLTEAEGSVRWIPKLR
jgi:hypothetical protein